MARPDYTESGIPWGTERDARNVLRSYEDRVRVRVDNEMVRVLDYTLESLPTDTVVMGRMRYRYTGRTPGVERERAFQFALEA